MKIALLTAGVLPVPAVQGGAVENLTDFLLEYNEAHALHDITVYSVAHPAVKGHPALAARHNHYRYTDTSSTVARLLKKLYLRRHGGREYYHYAVEYFLSRAMSHLSRQRYDVVVVENRPAFVLKLRERTTARLVVHQENDYINSDVPSGQAIYDSCDCIINTSAYITSRVRTLNAQDTKCRTVLNGIDTERFHQALPMARSSIGLAQDDFVVVYSGRLTAEKGIMELVQAMVRLSHLSRLRLLIVGASAYGTDQAPTPFVSELQEAARPVADRVVFTGYVDYRHVPSYLKAADVAVVPSMWDEPFGLTVAEALASGLPLVTTRSGGIPEICEGVATIVDRSDCVGQLADAIDTLYHQPSLRRTMGAAALERSRLFDKQTYARNYFEALADGLQ